jgi:hypothetical protein
MFTIGSSPSAPIRRREGRAGEEDGRTDHRREQDSGAGRRTIDKQPGEQPPDREAEEKGGDGCAIHRGSLVGRRAPIEAAWSVA